MKKPKYFLQMTSGIEFEISELDFNNLSGRQARGQTNGWYSQRGESMGTRHQWVVQFKDVASFWSDEDAKEIKEPRDLDEGKRLPPKVGKPDVPKEEVIVCTEHNWNDPSTYTYVSQSVNGMNRYYKQCPSCLSKSQIVKRREAELFMENIGKTIDDIPSFEQELLNARTSQR